ncbi:FAD-dependent oxidoreductase [Shimia abyssi]|uniref:2-polyprenyl-6-methoxyphenol hydroxylase-like FAD-dependent oxidoreductase n=1 Tax=Shimia abyssi TaxID=1662395 RepID=A0A2P8FBS1_9RHOB|nr:tryptophan 7-halogenase [Shimia abyssi]PSL19159.1 2-polyprenyl-6-methoxyphenol hydroxylase-like FAD-dependent oxidoreductase [Shimia abyssi]
MMDNFKNKKVVVIGAGMAGLMAASVLSPYFEDVVIIEKDNLPRTPHVRKGVPQGAHVHTFLGYAVEAMEDFLPGIMDELYEAGAVRIRRNLDIWFHDAAGPTPIRDAGLLTPSVTRPLLEHVTRRRVLALPNVNILEGTRFSKFCTGNAGEVTGVEILANDDKSSISTSLVVDCSGRASILPRMLAHEGYGDVKRQELGIGMAYTSGLFQPPAGLAKDAWACLMLAIPPNTRAAYLTPVDGGHWLATMYGRGGDIAPREAEGFVEWTKGLAHPVIYEKLSRAEPVSEFRTYKIPKGIWHRYDLMGRFPSGVIPMGEAFTSFNPMYGQGISLSAGQARALRSALAGGLDGLAPRYFEGSKPLNQVGWSVMETRDLEHSSTVGERPADIKSRWKMGAVIRELAETDAELHRLSVHVTHLLEHPSVLSRQDIVDRALELGN